MLPFVKRIKGVGSLTGELPPNLAQLTFGLRFNQPLAAGELPPNLTQLHFGEDFNQPLATGVLPANLTQLIRHLVILAVDSTSPWKWACCLAT